MFIFLGGAMPARLYSRRSSRDDPDRFCRRSDGRQVALVVWVPMMRADLVLVGWAAGCWAGPWQPRSESIGRAFRERARATALQNLSGSSRLIVLEYRRARHGAAEER